ncbi:hypothetical protein GQ43DRAFT_387082 [Delitschia confertaspora ATCC 74209]|uniref:HMG box domain-containing protein n=1 Tax=Delitschia confertaspora ATCC 74209 TaxID=1513339 RepID=A0A9P4MZ34_9PLEO|nr:hypothetical protein GQ43DRAFT_387082 [Delitschia confertaspora ATCC 74209]
MLARGVICRLAADVPKTSTHNLPQLARLFQRVAVAHNATPITYKSAPSSVYKLALVETRRLYATSGTTKKPATKTAAKKAPTKKAGTRGRKTTAKKAAPKKKKVKKVLTEEQLVKKKQAEERKKIAELREKALREPRPGPTTAWTVFITELGQESTVFSSVSKEASERYKNLSAAEREHYNHLANKNKAAAAARYQRWVLSHTPEKIRIANLARAQLKRKLKGTYKTRLNPPHTSKIQDDRQVKRPMTPWALFMTERLRSGDFKDISQKEAFGLISNEWKALSAAEKKKYENESAENKESYFREYRQTYNKDATAA